MPLPAPGLQGPSTPKISSPELPADTPPLHICLIGSGGVGTVAALVLTKSGCHVTAVLRSKFAYVSQHGWDIDSVDHGQVTSWKPHRVVAEVAAAAAVAAEETNPYDYVVVCTKQLPASNPVAAMIAPVVTPEHTCVVLIQNGIGIEEEVLRAWPRNAVISSVSHIGSSVEEPNRVLQTAPDVSKMGPHYAPDADEALRAACLRKAETFVTLYSAGGARRCELAPDISTARWEKLLWNGTFSTVCAMTRSDVGQVQRSGGRESLVVPMMWEIWKTARAAGHALPDSVVQWMAYRLSDDCAFRPSMLLDLEHGRPMELDVILGTPLSIARRLGVSTPYMDVVHRLLQVEDWKNRGGVPAAK